MVPRVTPRPVIDRLAFAFEKMLYDLSSTAMIKEPGDNFRDLGPDELNQHHSAGSLSTNGVESFGSPYEE